MNRHVALLLASLIVGALSSEYASGAEPASASPIPQFTAEELQADSQVLHDALTTLHPGLYRYSAPADFENRYHALQKSLSTGAGLDQAFLAYARFIAAIRCGHTWTNPLNQSLKVKAALLERPDRLPLHLTVVDRRFLVTQALPETSVLRGDEIQAVDGVPVSRIIDELWPYLRADGASDGKRLAQIGDDVEPAQSAFDLYYPLLHMSKDGTRILSLRSSGQNRTHDVRVRLVPQAARDIALAKQSDAPKSAWRYHIDGGLAIITMPTWAFWNAKFDWAHWLDDTFADIESRKIPNLVIDLRSNEGGDSSIGDALLSRLTVSPKTYNPVTQRLVFDVVPAALRPYLSTWDKSFYDQRGREAPLPNGGYTLRDAELAASTLLPDAHPYMGRTFVLIGPNNSSATFEFARIVKETGIATLVGQPTGGNLRGTDGGEILFLQLPNTGISVDLPLIAQEPLEAEPDAPVLPDVDVDPSLLLMSQGKDLDLLRVQELTHPS